MFLKRVFAVIICSLLLAACSDLADYTNEDVAAVVRGEKITVGDLRFLFTDDQVVENIAGVVKYTLVKQEVDRLGLNIEEELREAKDHPFIYPIKEIDDEHARGIRTFAEKQSAKFNMDPEAYYQEYYVLNGEISVYMIAYMREILGEELDDDEVNEILDDLVRENEAEIEILIK